MMGFKYKKYTFNLAKLILGSLLIFFGTKIKKLSELVSNKTTLTESFS